MMKAAWILIGVFWAGPSFSAGEVGSNTNPNSIVCEKAGTEIVICDEIPYRKERSGAISGTSRELKVPARRRPAIIGPFEEAPGVKPAP